MRRGSRVPRGGMRNCAEMDARRTYARPAPQSVAIFIRLDNTAPRQDAVPRLAELRGANEAGRREGGGDGGRGSRPDRRPSSEFVSRRWGEERESRKKRRRRLTE